MNDALPVVSVVAVLLIGVVIAAILIRRRQKLLGELSDSERQLHEQCVAADRAVRAAEATYKKAVRAAKKSLTAVENPAPMAKVGSNSVTPIEVRMNGRRHPLSRDVTAAIDQTGDIQAYATQRSTVTRMVTGSAVAGLGGALIGGAAKKTKHHKVDTRELYLMVVGPDWQEVAKLDPSKGDQARSVMQAINIAAQNSNAARQAHDNSVRQAREELARVEADTSGVDAAKEARSVLGEDPFVALKAARKGGSVGSTAADRPSASTDPGRGPLLVDWSESGDSPQDARPRRQD